MQNFNLDKAEYILFDWDGTLADTRDCHVDSINEVLAEYNLPDWSEARKLRDTSLSLKNNFPNIFGDNAKEAFEKYAAIYEKKAPAGVHKFPYIEELINLLRAKNKKLMVISNKDRKLLDIDCERLFPKGTFVKVVAGNEALKNKPYPEHAYYTLDEYLEPSEITPEKVWIIGDSSFDVECAIFANALPILVGKPLDKANIVYFKNFEDFYKALSS
ncbi:MAG: HAD family hydrolase [Lactobacillaceae bacterium]|jgi:phosphoglycolate phosphatase|nr:HAD family hydrolase [Lactobacillaceae bacterium]